MREHVPGVTVHGRHNTCSDSLNDRQFIAKIVMPAGKAIDSAFIPRRHVHIALHRYSKHPAQRIIKPDLFLPCTEDRACHNFVCFFECYHHNLNYSFFPSGSPRMRRASGGNETKTFSPVMKLFSSISRWVIST